MYFLAINKIKQDADPAAVGRIVPLHIEWTKNQIAKAKIVQAGKWGDREGMAIIRADDMAEARIILDEDPLVQSGLISFELAPLYPQVEIR